MIFFLFLILKLFEDQADPEKRSSEAIIEVADSLLGKKDVEASKYSKVTRLIKMSLGHLTLKMWGNSSTSSIPRLKVAREAQSLIENNSVDEVSQEANFKQIQQEILRLIQEKNNIPDESKIQNEGSPETVKSQENIERNETPLKTPKIEDETRKEKNLGLTEKEGFESFLGDDLSYSESKRSMKGSSIGASPQRRGSRPASQKSELRSELAATVGGVGINAESEEKSEKSEKRSNRVLREPSGLSKRSASRSLGKNDENSKRTFRISHSKIVKDSIFPSDDPYQSFV